MLSSNTRLWCYVMGPVVALLVCFPPASRAADPEPAPPGATGPRTESPGRFEDRPPSGPRERGRRHRRPLFEHLSQDVRLEVLDFLEEHVAELHQELVDLQYEDPNGFIRKMNRLLPQVLQLMRLEQDDPKVFPHRVKEVRISMQIRTLARRVRARGAQEHDEKQVGQLRKMLAKRFDLRQKIHRIEVQRLERRLAEAKKRLDQAETDKEPTVAQELEDMLITPHRGKRGKRLHAMPSRSDEPNP